MKTVDIDMGHLKSGGEKLPLELPAAILKLENVVWEKTSGERRLGTVHVRLKILFPYIKDDESYTAPHSVKTEVLEFYELIHYVRETINDITSGFHTKLYLINEGHIKSMPENWQWTYCLDWQCNIYSDDTYIESTAEITIDYNRLAQNNDFFERTNLNAVRIGEK